MGEDKKRIGALSPEAMKRMEEIMIRLEKRNPIMEDTVVYPRYYRPQLLDNPERAGL